MNRLNHPTLGTACMAIAAALLVACERSPQEAAVQPSEDARVVQAQPQPTPGVDTSPSPGTAAAKAGENALDKVKDAAITAAVNAQLAADPKLSALRIDVDTLDGRVRLSGQAPDSSSREHAGTLAARVDGVRGVDNQLLVAPAS